MNKTETHPEDTKTTARLSCNQIVLVLVLVLVLDRKHVPGAQRLSVGSVVTDKQVLSQLHSHQIFEHEHEHEHEKMW